MPTHERGVKTEQNETRKQRKDVKTLPVFLLPLPGD